MINISDFKKAWSDAQAEIAQEDEDWENETIHETIQAELAESDLQERLDILNRLEEAIDKFDQAFKGLKKSLDIK